MNKPVKILAVLIFAFILTNCTSIVRFSSEDIDSHPDDSTQYQLPSRIFYGNASYYHDKFHGRKTANGEIYDKFKLTAAHNTLKFGTLVRVTNTNNNRSVIVRINDRGPFKSSRVIDLSRAAAVEIDMIQAGIVYVKIEILD